MPPPQEPKTRIALIVSHPKRDLPGMVLLAAELARRGSTCFIVPTDLMVQEVFSLAPDVILLPHARRKWDARFFQRFFDAGIEIVVLDQEGTPFDFEWFEDSLVPKEIRERFLAYFCWGPQMSTFLRDAGLFRDEQVHVTGCPRMDFYASPWKEAALRVTAERARGLDDIVLFCSNFVVANPAPSLAEAIRRELAELHDPAKFGTYEQKLAIDGEALHGMIDLANELSSTYPDAQFVVRPHPYEDTRIYEQRLLDRANLKIRSEGAVDGWLIRARAVIQSACSTAVEASFLSVPALTPGWLVRDVEVPMSAACSVRFENREQLVKAVQRILDGTFELPAEVSASSQRILADLYLANDGNAHRRVADVLFDEVTTSSRSRHLARCRRVLLGRIVRGPSREGSWARWRRRLRLSASSPTARIEVRGAREKEEAFRSSNVYFTLSEVAALLDEIRKCSPEALRNVRTAKAGERREYHFGYDLGESIAVFC